MVTKVPSSMQTEESNLPAGMVAPFAGADAPTGWLLCYGQAVNRADYAALFAAIGTTYGAGNGSTTFALPDLRGRAIAGKDNMGGAAAGRLTTAGGITGTALGSSGGTQTHTLDATQMPLHGHPFQLSSNSASASTPTGGMMVTTNSSSSKAAHSGSVSNAVGEQIGGAGGGQAHNNVQPTMVLNFIIKI